MLLISPQTLTEKDTKKMPSIVDQIEITPLHDTFCAEVCGVDFSKPVAPHIIKQIQDAIDEVITLPLRLRSG